MKTCIKIVLVTLLLSSCKQAPATAQKSINSDPSIASERIENYLQKLEENGFSGSVLVAKDGKIIHREGYGYANRKKNQKVTPNTVFDIGSITKQFTGAAILKLEMQGKLKVTDRLSKYFENVPKDKKEISLHQLLTHSAGFPPAIGDDYEAISSEEFVDRAFARPLLFEPGSSYTYSNVGYSILGIIIEQVAEMTYEEYLSNNLWIPAGMKSTGYLLPELTNVAVGYQGDKTWGKPNTKNWSKEGPYWHLKANGGVLSTIGDMYQWDQALLGSSILSNEVKRKYYGKHVEEGEGAGSYYGYGWAIFPTPRDTELIAHNGGNGIFFADMWRYLTEDITIIYMTNAAERRFEHVASEIAHILLKPDYTPELKENQKLEGKQVDALLAEFMQTITSDDKTVWEKFINTKLTTTLRQGFTLEEHLEMFARLHRDLGKGKMVEVRIKENAVVILGVKKNDDSIQLLEFTLTEAMKVDGLRML
ncbi:serine hydrolase domain-containing protein [Aquimarina brevivitae]|uniref:CubicO group peptidase (Beta-lactamase class C family) n=1 Tax=Aquimarina brevivitae TaxID=323412 RepID=A0A4V2F5M9_9FLAO|nr:serine hydrolase domain-containing protein [Aquimarina brevivitae]RZS93379.1 CubicO group peptidase (beta-lactamase class C family) [Aquimarina brevivitae]